LSQRSATNFWNAFDTPANFLKHADRDWDKSIALDTLKTDWLLMAASAAYKDLMSAVEPEMIAYSAYYFAENAKKVPPKLATQLRELSSLSPADRRRACLSLLTYLKSKA
jgi:hypothetical protein